MSIQNSYPGGECPDCGEPISGLTEQGDECENCGHVFVGEDKPFLSSLDTAQSVELVRTARWLADSLEKESRPGDAKIIRTLVNDYIREKALPMG